MATVTKPARSQTLVEAHKRVRHPLERLRGYIRRYVAFEGVTVLFVFLALWLWLGILFDYGSFKLLTFDWVQDLPWAFRLVVLILLSVGLVATVALKVVGRLLREFKDASLALVLERRFPELLGDRLITAVELSDPAQAEAWGYSAAMVRETIHEASQRVEQLPLAEVFDWKRLRRQGLIALILTLGVYVLAGAGFSTVDAIKTGQVDALGGYSQLNEVAGIWFERNILLRNTIWPRRSQLELIGFDPSNEMRVAQGATPTIRVRAYKYVIAGAPRSGAVDGYHAWLETRGLKSEAVDDMVGTFRRSPPEGWRVLTWYDLTPELLGEDVPEVTFPEDWPVRDDGVGRTLDEIELQLAKEETHSTLDPNLKQTLDHVLERLAERAGDRSMRRTLRKLIVPETVTLIYKGKTTSSRNTLQRGADNEYTGKFGELKEDVTFTVQGEDYYTPKRKIVVVETPRLENLVCEQEQPAYLYFRPAPESNPADLRGRKQLIAASPVSLQGGDVARIDVPAGSDVVLVATASKPLKWVKVIPPPRKAKIQVKATKPELFDDGRRFRTRLTNVRAEQDFVFEFLDEDGITGLRQVAVIPQEDTAPKVRGLKPDDVIRQTKDGQYMVTVSARVPFKGNVKDDRGLSTVAYAYTLTKIELGAQFNVGALGLGSSVIPGTADGGFSPLGAAADLVLAHWLAAQPVKSKAPAAVRYFELPAFRQQLRDHDTGDRPSATEKSRGEFVPMPTVLDLLRQRQRAGYRSLLSNFDVKRDEWARVEQDPLACDLPLWKDGLKVDERQTQPRYRMELWLEATDNYLDGKLVAGKPVPHLGQSAERFTFLVVSEGELLTEIGKEEEVKYGELDEVLKKLLEWEGRLRQTSLDLAGNVKVKDLDNMIDRAEKIVSEALDKAQRDTKAVHQVYERILTEEKTNQVNAKIIERVDKTIVTPLAEIDAEFDRTREAVLEFRRALANTDLEPPVRIQGARQAGDKAKAQMRRLVGRLSDILGSMSGMIDIHKIIKILTDLETDEQRQAEKIQAVKDQLDKKILEGEDEPKKK